MFIEKKLEPPPIEQDWKRRVVVTTNLEITKESPSTLHLYYASVSMRLEQPRHFMRAGFQDDRLEWLGVIADALQKGLPIPEADFEEIVGALKRISEGTPAAKALGLTEDKRRRRKIDLNKMHQIASSVYYYSKNGHPITDNSSSPDALDCAYAMAAKEWGLDIDNNRENRELGIRRARQAWEIFGESITQFFETGLWNEPPPSIEKLTSSLRKKPKKKKPKK